MTRGIEKLFERDDIRISRLRGDELAVEYVECYDLYGEKKWSRNVFMTPYTDKDKTINRLAHYLVESIDR